MNLSFQYLIGCSCLVFLTTICSTRRNWRHDAYWKNRAALGTKDD